MVPLVVVAMVATIINIVEVVAGCMGRTHGKWNLADHDLLNLGAGSKNLLRLTHYSPPNVQY